MIKFLGTVAPNGAIYSPMYENRLDAHAWLRQADLRIEHGRGWVGCGSMGAIYFDNGRWIAARWAS